MLLDYVYWKNKAETFLYDKVCFLRLALLKALIYLHFHIKDCNFFLFFFIRDD